MPTRLLAALFGLWFAVVTVEPAALHSCPMHAGAGHANQGSHSGHSAPTAGHHEKAPATVVCSCVGMCATSVAPPPVASVEFERAEVAAGAPGLAKLVRPAAHLAHALPFSNGPPRA